MKSIHRQRGMTPIGWILVFLLIAFFVLIALKLVPIYLDSFTVGSVISDLKDEPGIATKSPREVESMIAKRLDINMVKGLKADDIYVEKVGDILNINAEYEVRENLLGNVDLVVHFDKSVQVSAR
ncbi:MAG: DUF4845 domain-containing protein [Thiohalomonadales bacterium]|nr:DUF4845 domain-containing protein [Thiohalomonadales bacterium]